MKRTIITGVLAVLALLLAQAGPAPTGGYALDFDGKSSYVSVSLTSPPANNYTLCAWVYLRSGGTFSGDRMAVLSSTTCGGSVELLIRANSDNPTDPQYVELGRCGFYNGFLSTVAVPFNLWTHVAVTVTSNNVVSYYVNGNPAGSFAGDPGRDYSLGSEVNFGDNSMRHFDGQLDEVQIWNRALSAPEIRRGIHSPLAGNEPGLFAYYRFNEGHDSAVVADSALAAGGSAGTLINNPQCVDSGVLLFPVPLNGFALAWGDGPTPGPQSGVVAVAANYQSGFLLGTNGTVAAWGGDTALAGQTNVVQIAAAGSSAAALKADGSLVVVGTITNVPAAAQSNIVAVSMGGQYGAYVLALKADGSVIGWGNNTYGQTDVPPAAQSDVVAVAGGWRHALALKTDGSVVCWGFNNFGECNTPPAAQSGVVAIAASLYISVALKADGSVVVWGLGDHGVPSDAQSNVVAIAAGCTGVAALKPDGTVVIWPEGLTNLGCPPISQGFPNAKFMSIAEGVGSSVGLAIPALPVITTQPFNGVSHMGNTSSLSAAGTGFYFGYQWQKDGVDISGAASSTFISGPAQGPMTGVYTLVLTNAFGSVTSAPVVLNPPPLPAPGRVIAWGDNSAGQCTVPAAAFSDVIAIAASPSNTMALKSDGSVLVWGDNTFGQTNVPDTASAGVVAIASGLRGSAALKADGSVIVWGDTTHGQTSVPLEAKSGVVAILCDPEGYVFQALKMDSSIVRWGTSRVDLPPSGAVAMGVGEANFYLYLDGRGAVSGSGNTAAGALNFPAAVQSNVVSTASGFLNSLALRAEGNVVAWGNYWDQSGVPAELSSGISAIASSGAHGLAIKVDKSLMLWGYDDVVRGGITAEAQNSVLAIATSYYHSAAIIDARPLLAITANGASFNVAWTTNFPGFALQQSVSLAPAAWKDYAGPTLIQGGSNVVVLPFGTANTFFRLSK